MDNWNADLDIDAQGQILSYPFWDIDRMFEHSGRRPSDVVDRFKYGMLIVTVWHGWDRVTPRKFRLTQLSRNH